MINDTYFTKPIPQHERVTMRCRRCPEKLEIIGGSRAQAIKAAGWHTGSGFQVLCPKCFDAGPDVVNYLNIKPKRPPKHFPRKF